MSTLDITCARCGKSFRVRSEFAGRNTRCPGCSAPLAIDGTPVAKKPTEKEEPKPTRKKVRSESSENFISWKPVRRALRQEQTALVFFGLQLLFDLLGYCVSQGMGAVGGSFIIMALMIFLFIGPAIVSGIMATMARVSASKVDPQSKARGTAVISLLCALTAMGSVALLGMSIVVSMNSNSGPSEAAVYIGLGGFLMAGFAAIITFIGFLAQVGITRHSTIIGASLGRAIGGIGITTIAFIGIALVYMCLETLLGTPHQYGRKPIDEGFAQVFLGVFFPVALVVCLILYNSLLAAARKELSDSSNADE